MVLFWLSRPFKKAHTVAQLVTQRWTDRWTMKQCGCAGTSLWVRVNHAWVFNLVMHSAMQAPPRYALKTSLLTRTTWTLACPFQNKLVLCSFWKHQYWCFLTCSFPLQLFWVDKETDSFLVKQQPATQDGVLGSFWASHGTALPPTQSQPRWNNKSIPDEWG